MDSTLYKIGDLAQLSGVSVKTIRYYSDLGVLPPTTTTEAGFRLYSDSDRARLELIRALREAGFSIFSVKQLLQNETSVVSTLESQLAVVEENLAQMRRQQNVIKAALNYGEDRALSYLGQARALANLDATGRNRFLDEHLNQALRDVPGGPAWRESICREALHGHLKKLNGGQTEAWLELADLILDQSFAKRLNSLAKQYLEDRSGYDVIEGWRQNEDKALAVTTTLALGGESPYTRRSQAFVQRFVEANATLMNRKNDPSLPKELLVLIEEGMDQRLGRFWELIGMLRGLPTGARWSRYQAHCWLHDGLKCWMLQTQTSYT